MSYQAGVSYYINTKITDCKQYTTNKRDSIIEALNTNLDYLFDRYDKHHNHTNYTCTAILLQNLAKLQWISVPCNKKLIADVICVVSKNNTNDTILNDRVNPSLACDHNFILLMNLCLNLKWHTKEHTGKVTAHYVSDLSQKKKFIKYLGSIVQNNVLSIFVNNLKNILTIKRFYNERKVTRSPAKVGSVAFLPFIKDRKLFFIKRYLFKCKEGKYQLFSDLFLHSFIDENCTRYTRLWNKNINKECPILLHLNSSGQCLLFISINTYTKEKIVNNINTSSALNTAITGCLVNYDDLKCSLLKDNYKNYCLEKGYFPCTIQERGCYSFSEICIYRLNNNGDLTPCKSGTQLYDCYHFECDISFKCVGFYCIPWSYVCDGKWDCPKGLDESANEGCGFIRSCINMLKCEGSQLCIHLASICDDIIDCPNGNDEGPHCMWNIPTCPISCECLISAVYCLSASYIDIDVIHSNKFNFFAVFIENSMISQTFLDIGRTNIVITFMFIHTISIRSSNITIPCYITQKMANLVFANFGFNLITVLIQRCFATYIKYLSLNDNKLTTMNTNIFQNSKSLLHLNLSNNLLKSLTHFKMECLVSLSLINNTLESLIVKDLSIPSLLIFETNDFRWCCLKPTSTKCTSPKPWFMSCKYLLLNTAIQLTFYHISILILVFNIISLLLLLVLNFRNDKDIPFNSIIRSVNLSDISYCISLGILLAADLYYKGDYIVKDKEWRSGILCFVTLMVNLNFNLLSPLLLLFMSVTRLMVVLHPLNSSFKEAKYLSRYLISIMTASFLTSILITILVRLFYKHIPTQLCSPFIDPTNSVIFTQLLTWVFAFIQVSSSLFICVIYSLLMKELRDSREKLKQARSNVQSNAPLIIQLIIVCTSNIMCWIPSNIIYLTAMFLDSYPVEMIIWTTIAVVPINCIINPIVFIVSNLKKMKTKS